LDALACRMHAGEARGHATHTTDPPIPPRSPKPGLCLGIRIEAMDKATPTLATPDR
jgi:hypothetical protein